MWPRSSKIFDLLQLSELNSGICSPCISSHYSCYKVCTTFRNILGLTRSAWLFQEIISFITPYLTKSDFLNCRVVCKWWKYGIEQFLENEEHSIGLMTKHKLMRNKYTICFSTYEMINSFLKELKDYPGNPFPGRVINLAYMRVSTEPLRNLGYEDFWKWKRHHLLYRLGHHLTGLHLRFRFDSHEWIVNTLNLLKSCLRSTPNLKSLCLAGYSPFHQNVEIDINRPIISLPCQPNLQSVQFTQERCSEHRHCNSIPVRLQYVICCGYFKQLKRLDISFVDTMGASRHEYPARLSCMQDIRVKVVSVRELGYIFDPVSNAFNHLRSVTIEMVNIRSLNLKGNKTNILADILQLLESYKTPIQELAIIIDETLSVSNIVEEEEVKILRHFKNLKYLRIQGFCFALVHLIKWLPKRLKYLHVSANKRYDPSRNECYVSKDLKYSDWTEWGALWMSLPYLRWIRVNGNEIVSGTRSHTATHQRDIWEWWVRVNDACKDAEMDESIFDPEDEESGNAILRCFHYTCLAAIFGLAFVILIVSILRNSN